MAVPSNVVRQAESTAFRANPKIKAGSGRIASKSEFEATISFNTTDGRTCAVKWRMGNYTYLG